MMRGRLLLLVLAAFAAAACARRAGAPLPGDSVDSDGHVTLSPPSFSPTGPARSSVEPLGAIESQLYPAELIMDHQAAIGLEQPQRDAIDKEVQHAQGDLLKLQWELQAEKEKLAGVLGAETVDEAKAKEVAERLMGREDRIKAVHLGMLVRIKNVLHPVQQAKLRALREAERCGPAGAPPGPDAGR